MSESSAIPPTLPAEVITGEIASEAVLDNPGIREFMFELTPYQRERFMQIAHHIAYLSFDSAIERTGQPFDKAVEKINKLVERESGKAYIRGILDCMEWFEDAANS